MQRKEPKKKWDMPRPSDIMRKGGVHDKDNKAKRKNKKQNLKRLVKEGDYDDL